MRNARIDINTGCYGILLREINSDFTVRESCLEELEDSTTGAHWVQTIRRDLPGRVRDIQQKLRVNGLLMQLHGTTILWMNMKPRADGGLRIKSVFTNQ